MRSRNRCCGRNGRQETERKSVRVLESVYEVLEGRERVVIQEERQGGAAYVDGGESRAV